MEVGETGSHKPHRHPHPPMSPVAQTEQPSNRATEQPSNRATGQPSNRATVRTGYVTDKSDRVRVHRRQLAQRRLIPWQETNEVTERNRFIVLAQEEDANSSVICRRFGIHRDTGYKWMKRFENGGFSAQGPELRTRVAAGGKTRPHTGVAATVGARRLNERARQR